MTTWPGYIPKNIIVRMPNWLGDVVMATPVLKDLKAAFPESRLTVMAQSNVAGLLQHDPHIDELYSFSKSSAWLRRIHRGDIVTALRSGKYDLGILLTNSFSSAWHFWRGHVESILGYARHGRSLLLDHAEAYPAKKQGLHQVVIYKKLLGAVGIPLSDTKPYLVVSEEEANGAKRLLADLGIGPDHQLVGINPGAAYGSAKCWLPERYHEVAKRLVEDPRVRVIFFGDNTGAPLVQQICKGLPDSVINLAARTSLLELVALLQQCSVLLTNDSGPMHIASALGTPLVALFGSTCDIATGPYAGGRVIHKRVACSPCFKRTCPIDFRCMTSISVDEVYSHLRQTMDSLSV